MCESGNYCSNIDTHPRYHLIAHKEYTRALRNAFWQDIHAKFRKDNKHLMPFAEALNYIQAVTHRKVGQTEVAIDHIIGRSGRFLDFNVSYLPKRRTNDDRWVNVAQAHFEGVQLPLVQLYKIDEHYYVVDGNHRVSVARVLGHTYIQAQVVEILSVDSDKNS